MGPGRAVAPGLLFLVLAVLVLVPVAMLAAGVFRTAPPSMGGTWSFAVFGEAARQPQILVAAAHSGVIAVVTTVVGLALALSFAMLSQRSDMPGRAAITPMMLTMFATPSMFYAIGYSLLANSAGGLLNAALHAAFGLPDAWLDTESWPGVLSAMTFRATAFMYLFIVGPVGALSRSMEDASLMAGFGPLATLWRIDLRLLAPALTGAAILGFIAGLQAFDTALILAEPAGIRVISTQIYDYLTAASPPRYALASLMSCALIVVVGGLVAAQGRILGRRSFVTVTGKSQRARPHRLGRAGWAAACAVAVYFVLAQVLPMVSLVVASLQPFPGVFRRLTVMHYARALTQPDVAEALRTTLLLAVTVGFAAMALALALAQAGRRLSPAGRGALRFLTLLPFAMPGIVTALAVTWAYVSLPGFRALYGTIWMLAVALVVVVLPFTMQAAQAALAQVAAELAEASVVSGAGRLRTLARVLAPLILPSFLNGWFVAAVVVAGNLDVPLLLGAPGMTTLAAVVYQLDGQGDFGDASALLVMVLAGLLVAGLLVAGLLVAGALVPAVRRWRAG